MKIKSFFFKFIIFIVCSYLLICIIRHIYIAITFSYETFIVSVCKIEKKSDAVGVMYKDELVLDFDGKGDIVKNIYPVGSKVDIDSEIARVYKTKEDASKFEHINKIDEDIKNLEEAQNILLEKNMDISSINKDIYINYGNLLEEIKKENFSNISEAKKNLTLLFNTKHAIVDKDINYDVILKKLKIERKNIGDVLNSPKVIVSPESGYFSVGVDGFEKECCLKCVDKLTVGEFCDFLKKIDYLGPTNDKIKIITSPKILFKALIPTKFLIDKKPGVYCKIIFKESGEEAVACLQDVYLNFEEEDSVAVFNVYSLTEKIARIRKSTAEIIFGRDFEGFKIPKEAVRVNENNETGVYVIDGVSLKFRVIDIIYETQDFVVCSVESKEVPKNKKYLRNFDRVILKGKDLYENKPI